MEEEKKVSPAKQKLIANYEQQRQRYLQDGYWEYNEVISVLKANVMALITAGPFAVIGIIIWIFAKKEEIFSRYLNQTVLFLVVFAACIFIHEMLHGAGWFLWTTEKWKSIYVGMMWKSLTPYCHCKEPLRPKQYLFGVLMPFLVLGVGVYVAAFISGSYMLLFLSLLNILVAGGDITIAWMELKYLKYKENCYILDHPTECGFIVFMKENQI